jgi:scyllo-inositol 2-dehydrogenase (NADP+)
VKSSYLVREQGPRYILHGTLGSFIKSGIDPQEEALKQGRHPGEEGWGKESQEWWGLLNTEVRGVTKRAVVQTLPGNYSAFYDNVFECIRNGATPAVKPEEALNVIRIIEAAIQSNQEKKTVCISA